MAEVDDVGERQIGEKADEVIDEPEQIRMPCSTEEGWVSGTGASYVENEDGVFVGQQWADAVPMFLGAPKVGCQEDCSFSRSVADYRMVVESSHARNVSYIFKRSQIDVSLRRRKVNTKIPAQRGQMGTCA